MSALELGGAQRSVLVLAEKDNRVDDPRDSRRRDDCRKARICEYLATASGHSGADTGVALTWNRWTLEGSPAV